MESAFQAGAELLIVITQSGREQVYMRGRDRMVLVRDEQASYEVGPPTLEETIELAIKSAQQARALEADAPELVFLQEESEALNSQPFGEIKVSGALKIYLDQNLDGPFSTFTNADPSVPFNLYEFSDENPDAALIGIPGWAYWVDISDPRLGVEFIWYRGQSEQYKLQSIVGENETVPVAMSSAPYDASKVGLISTDYNKTEDEYTPFQVQSPVVGPDVRVEFVVPAESNDTTTLGNYVVISFPASVYLEDEIVMRSLSNDPNHDPSQWIEDGRIYVAYGHLSEINHEHIYPGKIIDTLDEAIIGKTGNTGLQNPEPDIEHFNQHLDLAIVYYGSNMPGEMAAALQDYRSDPDNPHYFFGYAQRSTLLKNNDNRLYGENIDPDRIPGLFYVSTEASR